MLEASIQAFYGPWLDTSLMNGSKIGMGIGESRVDLDGSRVALESSLDVLHLFQGVAHVGIGVSERWLDPDGLLVVHQCLVQLTLLLKDRCEV